MKEAVEKLVEERDYLVELLSEEISGIKYYLNKEGIDVERKASSVVSASRKLTELLAKIEVLELAAKRLERAQ